eukprot:171378-Rhodomonas_salina.1
MHYAARNRYMPFFVEDYKWTSANYLNMSARSTDYKRWWDIVSGLVQDSGQYTPKSNTRNRIPDLGVQQFTVGAYSSIIQWRYAVAAHRRAPL